MATFETSTKRPDIDNKQTLETAPVQAYAKLESDDFCYYIRTLQVTLGRKVKNPDNVDIPLGNVKSVSRQHARLFYNFTTHRFELMIFGKNGAFVNEQFVEKGATVPLENKTKIQIGDLSFVFLLPRMDLSETPRNQELNYISTPQQLEKKRSQHYSQHQEKKKRPSIQLSPPKDDFWAESSSPDDITLYASKDVKPPYSYASLIAQAINSTNNKRMTLHGIYTFINTTYPYYQMASNGWQNSIRHNLSLNKAFVKVLRKDSEPGKGAFWTIDSTAENQFSKGVYKKFKRSNSTTKEMSHSSDKHVKEHDDDHDHDEDEESVADQDNDSDVEPIQIKKEPLDMSVSSIKSDPEPQKVPLADVKREPSTSPKPKILPAPSSSSANKMQSELQEAIQQHLLDPIKYPLPTSIAQLLPQAIAKLPSELADQISNALASSIVTGNSSKQES